MRVVTRAAAVLVTAAALAVPSPAQAVEVCFENNQLTFSPPLTADMKAGTVTIDYQGTCPAAPGLTPRSYAGRTVTTYFGSCYLAFFEQGGTSVYAGGAVYAFVRGSVQVKGELMTTSVAQCPISSASGTGLLVSIPEVPEA